MKNKGSASNRPGNKHRCPLSLETLTQDNIKDFILVKVIAAQDKGAYYFIHTSVQYKFFGLDSCPKTRATKEYKALYLKDLSQELQSEVIKLTDNTEFDPFFAKKELQNHIKTGTFNFKKAVTAGNTTLTEFKELIIRYPLQLDAVIDEHGSTALIWAAEKGHTDIVDALLGVTGINVNTANMYGNTALIFATDKGHTDIVDALLAKEGLNVNFANEHGDTALTCAVDKGHTDIVKALLAKEGIDANAADQDGDTALTCAAAKGHIEVVNALLVKEGIDANAATNNGNTALIWAAYKGHTDMVKALLDVTGIKVNTANQYGNTALIDAAANGYKDIVNALLAKKGIDVNVANKHGDTALMSAWTQGHKDTVNLLIANGANRYWGEFLLPAVCSFVSLGLFIASIFIAAPLAAVVGTGLLFAVSTIYLSQLVFPKITASYVVSPSENPLQAGSIATNNSSSPYTDVGTNSAAAEARKDSVNSDGATEESKESYEQSNHKPGHTPT